MQDIKDGAYVGCWVIVVAVFVLLLMWSMVAISFGLEVATAGLVGRGQAHIEIQSAPFRLEAYNYFFNQCASIQALEGQIDELSNQLEMMEQGSREYNITLSSLTGVKAMRRTAIANYNAEAAKDYTVGQFRDNDLPYSLPNVEYNGEIKTSCVSF